jgi:hypothetical protein
LDTFFLGFKKSWDPFFFSLFSFSKIGKCLQNSKILQNKHMLKRIRQFSFQNNENSPKEIIEWDKCSTAGSTFGFASSTHDMSKQWATVVKVWINIP